jgi:hypothetical protein
MERMVAEDVSMLSGKKLSFAEIILSFVRKEGIRSHNAPIGSPLPCISHTIRQVHRSRGSKSGTIDCLIDQLSAWYALRNKTTSLVQARNEAMTAAALLYSTYD